MRIDFICTDHDRHPVRFVAWVDSDDPMRPSRGNRRHSEEERRINAGDHRPGYDPYHQGTVQLACSTCRINRQRTAERWAEMVAALAANGVGRVDLSHLPD